MSNNQELSTHGEHIPLSLNIKDISGDSLGEIVSVSGGFFFPIKQEKTATTIAIAKVHRDGYSHFFHLLC